MKRHGGHQRENMMDDGGGGGAPGTKVAKGCRVCPQMVRISPGMAMLGSTHQISSGGLKSGPAAQTNFHKSFAIGKFEVTLGEFQAFVKDTNYTPTGRCQRSDGSRGTISSLSPGFPQTSRHPVVCVNFTDASKYVEWLKNKTGKNFRLPSEAEWEFAARAGILEAFMTGERMSPRAANFHSKYANRQPGTMPVGSFSANKNGMYDVHGNVWEIVGDCWSQYYQVASAKNKSPIGGVDCSRHIVKGGGWASPLKQNGFAMRGAIPNHMASNSVGFRVMHP